MGREQTGRLMRKAGLRGVQRDKPVFTTITDPAAAGPADLVNRQFQAAAPNRYGSPTSPSYGSYLVSFMTSSHSRSVS